MKKIITALTLSTLLAGSAFAQAPIQTAQPVAPAVVGRTITEQQQPAPKAVAKKAKSGKHASAKKGKKGSKKVSAKSGSSFHLGLAGIK